MGHVLWIWSAIVTAEFSERFNFKDNISSGSIAFFTKLISSSGTNFKRFKRSIINVNENPKAARCEIRFPDAAGNPYLTFASMLMAGIDGIKNKIDPGKSFDDDLYSLSENEVKKLPTVCGSLREAMQNLDQDRKFLTQGEVFTDDQIDAYIDLKFQEIYKFEHTPHPIEFEMYYSS